AEDGIRGFHVTGVQTCALPISLRSTSVWKAIVSRPPPSSALSSRTARISRIAASPRLTMAMRVNKLGKPHNLLLASGNRGDESGRAGVAARIRPHTPPSPEDGGHRNDRTRHVAPGPFVGTPQNRRHRARADPQPQRDVHRGRARVHGGFARRTGTPRHATRRPGLRTR